LKVPVAYQDERHSSSEAELHFWATGRSPDKNRARLDPLAAGLILQAFLDGPRTDEVTAG
jgi:RNase H-fold protein (predicted Holliday junction resolvase)